MPYDRALVRLLPPNEAIDLQEMLEWAGYSECGAVVTFSGLVRQTEEGRMLSGLDYEAHPEMAERELERITHQALSQFAIRRAACFHRTGEVSVQTASVVVVVGADHRAPAFEACEFIMNELKQRVPIWKAPVFAKASTSDL